MTSQQWRAELEAKRAGDTEWLKTSRAEHAEQEERLLDEVTDSIRTTLGR